MVLRKKIRKWAGLASGGQESPAAARAVGLPPLLVETVAAGQASGNLPDAMGFLRRHYNAKVSRLAEVLKASVLPMMVLLMAVVLSQY